MPFTLTFHSERFQMMRTAKYTANVPVLSGGHQSAQWFLCIYNFASKFSTWVSWIQSSRNPTLENSCDSFKDEIEVLKAGMKCNGHFQLSHTSKDHQKTEHYHWVISNLSFTHLNCVHHRTIKVKSTIHDRNVHSNIVLVNSLDMRSWKAAMIV